MKGLKLEEFIDSLYYNPELEFTYDGTNYVLSGYIDNCASIYTIELCNKDTGNIVFLKRSNSRTDCVLSFEQAKVFNHKTIYDVEQGIEVLYG